MVGRTNAGGGGGGSSSFVAYIQITTDANAVISAVNPAGDSFTGTADSTGSLTLTVTAAGTYTVSISGTASSTTVQVIDSGETYTATVLSWDGTLYDNGDEYTGITGGWVPLALGTTSNTKSPPGITRYPTFIEAYQSGYLQDGLFLTSEKVDLSSYTTLDIAYSTWCQITGELIVIAYDGSAITKIATLTVTTTQTASSISLGISSYTGEYRLGFELITAGNSNCRVYLRLMQMKLR